MTAPADLIPARLSALKAGQSVISRELGPCLPDGTHTVCRAPEGLFLPCADGRHYLDGQTLEDGDTLAGLFLPSDQGVKAMGYGPSGLNFNALRGANLARLPLFRNAQGQPAHSEPDGSDWSAAQWLQAVTGELGELANVMKKIDRGDFTRAEAQQQLADELADVQTYLDILAMRLGVDLGNATVDKFNRVSARVKAGVRLEPADWYYDSKLGDVPEGVRA